MVFNRHLYRKQERLTPNVLFLGEPWEGYRKVTPDRDILKRATGVKRGPLRAGTRARPPLRPKPSRAAPSSTRGLPPGRWGTNKGQEAGFSNLRREERYGKTGRGRAGLGWSRPGGRHETDGAAAHGPHGSLETADNSADERMNERMNARTHEPRRGGYRPASLIPAKPL